MQHAVIVTLKALLAVLIAVLLTCQVFLVPAVAAATARVHPEAAFLRTPGIILAVIFLLCVQLGLVCVWRLLSLVRTGTIFSTRSFVLVDTIIALIWIASAIALVAGIGLQLLQIGSSASIVAFLGAILGTSSALLLIVMRGLIRQATQLQAELAEVV